jgi:amidase
MDSDLAFMGLVDVGKQIAKRKISPVEVTRAMLGRMEALEPQLGCYVVVMADQAIKDAKRREAEVKKGDLCGPLHGVPVAVKDLCDVAGQPTAAGIPKFSDRIAKLDSTVVARLRDAGAVILGKLQLTEGALALHHPDVKPPVNPWRADRWSGASSSGSGAAVAAGLTYGALGSDTGGSIRFPALANGVVGLKPTWGRVSRFGVFPLSETLDHIGPLARKVEDTAAMLGAIAGRDGNDPSSASEPVPDYLKGLRKGVRGVRIGIDRRYAFKGVHKDVRAVLERALEVLGAQGATIAEVKMPAVDEAITAWATIIAADAAAAHAETYPSRKKIYSEVFRAFLDAGRAASAVDYARAEIVRRNFRGQMAALFQDIDLMVKPVIRMLNPSVEDFVASAAKEGALMDLVHFTCLDDLTGVPTITLPAGLDRNGSPLGFQLVARPFEEALLCRAGRVWQETSGIAEAQPLLAA